MTIFLHFFRPFTYAVFEICDSLSTMGLRKRSVKDKIKIMVMSNIIRKYTFVYPFLFSHNVIVNMCINEYLISVWEQNNTLTQ